MKQQLDLVIRGGSVVDGSGAAPFEADVGVLDGKIVRIGTVHGKGAEEIDAKGLLVTPGFVDIHTHYDGQATWESHMTPSSMHGVTTALIGNCGVGFAPCRPEDREKLINVMEGVEDIPGIVMSEGLPWAWETFPQYLDYLQTRPRDIDIATQLPHSPLRVFVMGDRAVAGEPATEPDMRRMAQLSREAIAAGALGFATSRTGTHKDKNGNPIPSTSALESELAAIASGLTAAGTGVIQALVDFNDLRTNYGVLRRLAEKCGRPLSFTLHYHLDAPDAWRIGLDLLDEAKADGLPVRAQVIGRPTGMILGHSVSYNPFSLRPTYARIADLPLAQKMAELRKPEIREKILREQPGDLTLPVLKFLERYKWMFVMDDGFDYEPPLDTSIAARAAKAGVSPEELAYDLMLADDGHAMLFVAASNYGTGNLDPVVEMLKHDRTILGLGDGGAHYGMICDAGYPSFMLSFWTRDRRSGEKLSIPEVVKQLSWDTASAVGLNDRGLLREGYKGDLNVIDYDRLRLHKPRVVFDLPAHGRRLVQDASGYVATIVNGRVTYRDGAPTGLMPGQLIRGPQTVAQL